MGEPIHKLQENAHAEMVARKKTQGWDNRQAPFNSLAVVLTESSGCLTRLIYLIYKSVVFIC